MWTDARLDERFDRIDGRFDRIEQRLDRIEVEMRAGFAAVRRDMFNAVVALSAGNLAVVAALIATR